MEDNEIVAGVQGWLGVTRPELEHVIGCGGCEPVGRDGPQFCRAFEIEFRGWAPRPQTEAEKATGRVMAAIWNPSIKAFAAASVRPMVASDPGPPPDARVSR